MDRTPEQTVVMMSIPQEEYLMFRGGMPADPRLPADYKLWCANTSRARNTLQAMGVRAARVNVRYDEFIDYAQRLNATPCYGLLEAYAAGVAAMERRFGPGRL